MPEVRTRVEVYKVQMLCDKCKEMGAPPYEMKPTGTVLTSNPPWYEHQCTNPQCNNLETYRRVYPYNEFKEVKSV